MKNINPPVHQIYLVGPEKQGRSIARRIYSGAVRIRELFQNIDLDAIIRKYKEQEVTHS